MGLSVDLHEDLVQTPPPLGDLPHLARATNADLASKDRTEPVYPEPYALMADVDPALVKKILDVSKRQRKADVHHNRELDNLRRRFEVAEG